MCFIPGQPYDETTIQGVDGREWIEYSIVCMITHVPTYYVKIYLQFNIVIGCSVVMMWWL